MTKFMQTYMLKKLVVVLLAVECLTMIAI